MLNYPTPCTVCAKAEICKTNGCGEYRKWVNSWWKFFKGMFRKPVKRDKFRYEHPDHIRQYLQKGPCDKCKAADLCDNPCQAYLRWYDARMEIVRKKVGYENTDKSV